MTLTLAALVVASLQPTVAVAPLVSAQKIQIIKGGSKKAKPAAKADAELAPQMIQDSSQANAAKSAELDRKAAALDAKDRELAEKEQALDEKQKANAEAEKKQAEKQKALQKKIEKLGEENEKNFGAAADALAGD